MRTRSAWWLFEHERLDFAIRSDTAALWLKRHGKRTQGSLLVASICRRCGVMLRGFGGATRSRLLTRALDFRRRSGVGVARIGRRSLPPAIVIVGQQTGRERPRLLNARVSPARSVGSLTSCLRADCRRGCRHRSTHHRSVRRHCTCHGWRPPADTRFDGSQPRFS